MPRTKGSTNKPKLVTWNGSKNDPALFLRDLMLDVSQDMRHRAKAAADLLPFVHRKQPTLIEGETGGIQSVHFVIG
jgi:hypothetical protein